MANIGIVLSGGMAKGAYQIGVLKALNEFLTDDSIRHISASSIGSLNAYAYASKKLKLAEDMWRGLKADGMHTVIKTFIRTPFISNAIDYLVTENDQLHRCLYITCFNITKMKLNYINLFNVERKEMKSYLKASVTLPIFSEAVEISNAKYFDGALIDNIPVYPLIKHNLDYIIVVHHGNNTCVFEDELFDSRLIKINFMDEKIIKNTFAFDQPSVIHMIKSGYEQSRAIFEIIFKNGTDDLDYIYRMIGLCNDSKKCRQFRVTADTVLGNINSFTKRAARK